MTPLTCETPTEKLKHGGERRFADQGDREYELMSHNVHPMQLLAYQLNNQELQKQNEAQELRNAGEVPLEDQASQYFEQRIAEEQANLPEGQKISYDRYAEILGDSIRKYLAEVAIPGSTKDAHGNFTDFVEVRRPFVEPTHQGHAQ